MDELLDNSERVHKERKRTFLRISTIALSGIYAAGILLSLYSIFSILLSGPAILIISLVPLIAGFILKEKVLILFGSTAVLSVLGIFLVIYFFRIAPNEAKFVVPILGTFSLMVLIGMTVWMFVSLKKDS